MPHKYLREQSQSSKQFYSNSESGVGRLDEYYGNRELLHKPCEIPAGYPSDCVEVITDSWCSFKSVSSYKDVSKILVFFSLLLPQVVPFPTSFSHFSNQVLIYSLLKL